MAATLLVRVCLELQAVVMTATAWEVPETRAAWLLIANTVPVAKPIHWWQALPCSNI